MKKKLSSVILLTLSISAPALADPPNDCGPTDPITGSDMYCGWYVQSNGGNLFCQCFGGEDCVDSNNNINRKVPFGSGTTLAPGMCTTPSTFACVPGSQSLALQCRGDSVCAGSSNNPVCEIPNACPAFTCGNVSDGAGGHLACATAGSWCLPMTVTISNATKPGAPIGVEDETTITLTNGPENFPTFFALWLTQPNGTVVKSVQSWQWANSNGNCSATISAWGFLSAGGPGLWHMQAQSIQTNPNGFNWSNDLVFEVEANP